jgi:hypothetical protein
MMGFSVGVDAEMKSQTLKTCNVKPQDLGPPGTFCTKSTGPSGRPEGCMDQQTETCAWSEPILH